MPRVIETAPPAPNFDLDKLRLCFRDPAIERVFESDTLKQSLGIIRIYVVAGTSLYVMFGALDSIVGGSALLTLLIIRYCIVCPVLVSVFLLTFIPVFERIGQFALAAIMISTGFGIVAMTAIMPPPYNAQYYAGLIMVVIYCSSLIRLRFLYAVVIAVTLVSAYQIAPVFLNPIPLATYISNDFFLVMATSVGLFSGYIQELYVRRSYVSQKIIEAKNEDLKELLVEADKANRSKNEFLATMSHELRTPLNAIIGFSDILRKQSFGPLGHARYAEYIQDINASGSHLLAIINDILDLAKAEAGKLQLREDETDLVQCLQNCVQMCRGRADDGGVQLNLWFAQPEIYALVDERLLLQLMLNLISNAIKFTPSGGSIQINLQANWRDGILIDVIDTGIGIPKQDIERVLRPFEQVENTFSRQHGGTGLGLPFAKKLAELHGGTITIDSEIDSGTHIVVSLPAERLLPGRYAPPVKRAV